MVETHAFGDLENMCEVNMSAISSLGATEDAIDLESSILSHLAIMEESLGNPEGALKTALKGYDLRLEHQQKPSQVLQAWTESNIGYTSNTANNHADAKRWFEKARDRWTSMQASGEDCGPWPTVQKKNLGRCLVYLDELAEAQKLFDESIAEFRPSLPVNWAMLA